MSSTSLAAASTLQVELPNTSYPVHVGTGLLEQVGASLDDLLGGTVRSGRSRLFIITSPEIDALWGPQLRSGLPPGVPTLHIPAGEAQKRLGTIERLAEELATLQADRDSILLALGGGVLGDLTGFLAAIYMRGLRFVQIPTTLLAQVDSSVGGKTGANLRAGKNLVGAFHHPIAVFADIGTLGTLPGAELRAGLQEAVKSAIIRDEALFTFLERERAAIFAGDHQALQHVVTSCVRIKAAVVAADEREGGLRMILNLGHTLGHALEAATGYTQLLHGEAIAWGMLAAVSLAQQRATVTPAEADRLTSLIRAYGPLRPFAVTAQDLVALTARDKKHRGGVRSFVLPVGIGEAVVVRDLAEIELLGAAEAICVEAAGLATP